MLGKFRAKFGSVLKVKSTGQLTQPDITLFLAPSQPRIGHILDSSPTLFGNRVFSRNGSESPEPVVWLVGLSNEPSEDERQSSRAHSDHLLIGRVHGDLRHRGIDSRR